MKRIIRILLLVGLCTAQTAAHADSESDQLREALRSAILQARQLEDQRASLQSELAKTKDDAARAKAAADSAIKAAKAQARKSEADYREAVVQFNQRLTERDETLEKWKSAYEEAATVARAKDAERAKFQNEAANFKASTKSCIGHNQRLVKNAHELLQAYKAVSIGDALLTHEPMFGVKRTEYEGRIQDFGDKILDEKVNP